MFLACVCPARGVPFSPLWDRAFSRSATPHRSSFNSVVQLSACLTSAERLLPPSWQIPTLCTTKPFVRQSFSAAKQKQYNSFNHMLSSSDVFYTKAVDLSNFTSRFLTTTKSITQIMVRNFNFFKSFNL